MTGLLLICLLFVVTARAAKLCDPHGGEVSVVFAADHGQWIGLLTAIVSIRRNTRCADRLQFYAFVTAEEERYFRQSLQQCLEEESKSITVVVFDPLADDVHRIFTKGATLRGRLAYAHNFVRFYFESYLPHLDKILYMDADMLAEGDIVALYDSTLMDPHNEVFIVAAAHRVVNETYGAFVNVQHDAIAARVKIDPGEATFNAGLMLIRFDLWRKFDITRKIEQWMALHEEFGADLWTLGSQPPLLLALHNRVQWLEKEWNYRAADALGEALKKVKVLHFNGHFKPWHPLISHSSDAGDERAWKRNAQDRWLFYNKRMWDRDCQPAAVVQPATLWSDAFASVDTAHDAERQRVERSHSLLTTGVALLVGAAVGYLLARQTRPPSHSAV